jgi:type I restriction enzyme S subunit
VSVPEPNSLPESWSWATLEELGSWGGGGTPSMARPEFWTNGKYPWVSSKDMKRFELFDTEDHITSEAIKESSTNLYPAGTVLLVTRSGILRHTLPVAVSCAAVTINQDLKALTPHKGIDAKYVAYAIRAAGQKILQECAKDGTTVQSVEFDALKRWVSRAE